MRNGKQRVAIIGTGISGNAAALALSQSPYHEIVVYEAANRPGGHSATIDIDYDGANIAVDTGFIVFNTLNYPNLTAMFDWAGVETQASDMSFSVSADNGRFEWCGRETKPLGGLFAQKRNALSPSFLLMLREIMRFQKTATAEFRAGKINDVSLGVYLSVHGFSKRLRDDYLLPMGAAIWSMSPRAMMEFPARSFIAFFNNHHLLQWDRPQWRTVTGGSRSYVEKITQFWAKDLRLGTAVIGVTRHSNGVEVLDSMGGVEQFDSVIIASHAPQALAMLRDANAREKQILGAVRTSDNTVYLHRDPRLMPKRKAAWAAWNFLREGKNDEAKVAVTYWMNILQNIDQSKPLFVSLNPPFAPDPTLTFGTYSYAHPQFDRPALGAQEQLHAIQGNRRTYFCGAWTAYGFHEDGFVSGLNVARMLGAEMPWTKREELLEAAE